MTDTQDKIKELQGALDKTAGEIRILRFIDYLKKVTFYDETGKGESIKASFRTDGKNIFLSTVFARFFPRFKGNDHTIEFSITIDEKTSEFSRDLIALIEKHKDCLSSNERF
jgi:hypothetical protein